MIKLILTWNIREGKETEYLEFLTQEFAKSFMAMGVQPTDAWYAVWGHGPQVLAGGVTQDMEAMDRALASEEWTKLQARLDRLVIDLSYKVVEHTRGFQL